MPNTQSVIECSRDSLLVMAKYRLLLLRSLKFAIVQLEAETIQLSLKSFCVSIIGNDLILY